MRLSKHHGLHNDFLVVLDEANEAPVRAGPELARALCDRREGLGADGLIHGARPEQSAGIDAVMHLWNADGSRAEMSGNGIRCLAQALLCARRLVAGVLEVQTDAGLRSLRVAPSDRAGTVSVEVDMGEVLPGPDPAGVELGFEAVELGSVSLGNPHLVAWVADPDALDLAAIGSRLQPQLPGGVNLEVVSEGSEPGSLRMRVWERGVGISEACGTGACAAAHLARSWGRSAELVRVEMPGGSVEVELVGTQVVLRGPAAHVADLWVSGAVIGDG